MTTKSTKDKESSKKAQSDEEDDGSFLLNVSMARDTFKKVKELMSNKSVLVNFTIDEQNRKLQMVFETDPAAIKTALRRGAKQVLKHRKEDKIPYVV
jgi:hypothetical protein